MHVLHGAGLMALVAGPFNALTMYAQFAHDSGAARLVYIALYVALIYASMVLQCCCMLCSILQHA